MSSDFVGTSVIAELLVLSKRRIRQLAEEGVIKAEKRGKSWKFDLFKAIRSYVEYLENENELKKAKEDDLAALKLKIMEAEIDYKRVKADMEVLKFTEMSRNMHRAEDVKEAFEQFARTIEEAIVKLPEKLATPLLKASSPAEAEEIIKREIDFVLEKLANFRYEPDTIGEHDADEDHLFCFDSSY